MTPKYFVLSLKHSQNAGYLCFFMDFIDNDDTGSVSRNVNQACVVYEKLKLDENFLYVPVELLDELEDEKEESKENEGEISIVYNTPENLKKLGLKQEDGILMREPGEPNTEEPQKEKPSGEAPKVNWLKIGLSVISLGVDLKKAYEQSKLKPKSRTTNINILAANIHLINQEKGFWDKKRNVGEMLMLVTSELGEAMEAHRKGKSADWIGYQEAMEGTEPMEQQEAFEHCIKDSFEDEIADAVIRLLDLAAGLNINLEQHIEAKLAYNQTRARFHGKKY
jgi:NTP pyrophosphatase (non-canonical NTP hydrolase)